jgi:Tfp pilus assembly ATPase PilU
MRNNQQGASLPLRAHPPQVSGTAAGCRRRPAAVTSREKRKAAKPSPPLDARRAAGVVAAMIREGKIAQMYSSIQTGQTHGMQTLDQCLQGMVERGLVSKEEARFKAQNKESI